MIEPIKTQDISTRASKKPSIVKDKLVSEAQNLHNIEMRKTLDDISKSYPDKAWKDYTLGQQLAVMCFFGKVPWDELTEALSVSNESLNQAAIWSGIANKNYEDSILAENIEMFVRFIDQHKEKAQEMAGLFGVDYEPDRKFIHVDEFKEATQQYLFNEEGSNEC